MADRLAVAFFACLTMAFFAGGFTMASAACFAPLVSAFRTAVGVAPFPNAFFAAALTGSERAAFFAAVSTALI